MLHGAHGEEYNPKFSLQALGHPHGLGSMAAVCMLLAVPVLCGSHSSLGVILPKLWKVEAVSARGHGQAGVLCGKVVWAQGVIYLRIGTLPP